MATYYNRNKFSGIIFVLFFVLGSMVQNGYSSYHYDKAVINTFNTGNYEGTWVHDVYNTDGSINSTFKGLNLYLIYCKLTTV